MVAPDAPTEFTRAIGGGEHPCHAVVEAVSVVTNTDPLGLPPLADTLDPSGLHVVFRGDGDPTVSFTYAGCAIEVDQSMVSVTPQADP